MRAMRVALALVLALGVLGCAHREPVRIRVLTYNIHHGEGTDGEFDLERIAGVIRRAEPDVVALQEVDVGTGRAGGFDQARALAELTGMSAVFGRAMDYDGGQYGDAVLTRLTVQDLAVHILPHAPDHEPRTATAVTVSASGRRFVFASTHLDHTRDESDRVAQARRINELLGAGTIPTILAGDLNAQPGQRPMMVLAESWVDASAGNPQPTFPSDQASRRIDYVLYRPESNWRIVGSRVLHEPLASDHCPLLVVLELVRGDDGDIRVLSGNADGIRENNRQ